MEIWEVNFLDDVEIRIECDEARNSKMEIVSKQKPNQYCDEKLIASTNKTVRCKIVVFEIGT